MEPRSSPSSRARPLDDDGLSAQLDESKTALGALGSEMERMRATLDELFRVEAQETALYVRETQLEMQAIRDVLRLEKEQVRYATARAIDAALESGADAIREFEALRTETAAKTLQLRADLRRREQQHHDALQRVRDEREKEVRSLEAQLQKLKAHRDAGDARTADSIGAANDSSSSLSWQLLGQADAQNALPLAAVASVLLVLLACVTSMIRARRAARYRQQRVLYSLQLHQHFEQLPPRENHDDDLQATPLQAPQEERRPTLRQRTKDSRMTASLSTRRATSTRRR
ncbi:hypothetical protein ATCC90586_008691 [Pythium insidiosum]|nr:hypothetical protein ATCC90586_008691 [Pythium insidiosum]